MFLVCRANSDSPELETSYSDEEEIRVVVASARIVMQQYASLLHLLRSLVAVRLLRRFCFASWGAA